MNSARDSKHGRTLYDGAALSPFVQHLVASNWHKGIKGVGLTSSVIHNLVVIGPNLVGA